jgi:nitric oxide reductase subunit C
MSDAGQSSSRRCYAIRRRCIPGSVAFKYNFTDAEIAALVAFLQWIGDMDLNGFPAKPTLLPVAVPAPATGEVVASPERPKIFNQMCIACHSLEGQGGAVGPALDGVGNRRSYDNLVAWITDPPQQKPGTLMPKLPLTQADVVELASFLSKMKQR